MKRNIAAFLGGLLLAVMAFGYAAKTPDHKYNAAACVGPSFRTVEVRKRAIEDGYTINPHYDCIDKASYAQANERKAAQQRALANASTRQAVASIDEPTLAQARRGFATTISVHSKTPSPSPDPPANLFVRSYYKGATGRVLPGYVTPDPRDGLKHPAIIWLTGSDTNSLGDFWNDSSAASFREAGVVVMLPALRGGNMDTNGKEYFFGEVDDVLAAAEHLAGLGYVNADRVFLGGHSTGGTLALLTAEMGTRFAGVFAFGPVDEVDRYSSSVVPVNFREQQAALERKLRSPIHWLHGIASPTYLIEGNNLPGNRREVETMCKKSSNPQLHCVLVDGADHFSVLAKVSTVIAARLAISDSREFAMRADEFQDGSGSVEIAFAQANSDESAK